MPAQLEISDLWQVMAKLDLPVRKLTHRRDTLEEIFLKAVGHLQRTPGEAKEVTANGRL
jgi:hypothetical protein